jgi:hypothetical protein
MAQAKQKFLQVTQQGRELHFVLGNNLRVVAKPDDLDESMRDSALFHGINQKVRDAAAGFSKDGDYSGAFRAMQTVVDNLTNGLWNAKGGTGTADLVAAIANLKGIDVETAQGLIDGLDDEQVKTLMGKASVKAEILKIKAERAAKVAEASDDDDDLGI